MDDRFVTKNTPPYRGKLSRAVFFQWSLIAFTVRSRILREKCILRQPSFGDILGGSSKSMDWPSCQLGFGETTLSTRILKHIYTMLLKLLHQREWEFRDADRETQQQCRSSPKCLSLGHNCDREGKGMIAQFYSMLEQDKPLSSLSPNVKRERLS